MPKQTESSVQKNRTWFNNNNDAYRQNVEEIDTYRYLRAAIDGALTSAGSLLDIGNGGVFDYDIGCATSLTAVDLFLDDIDTSGFPEHVRFVQGSALDLPFSAAEFDTVVIVMLLHHLVGSTVEESRANVRKCIAECRRVLKPGGRFVLVESCIPQWFYGFEQMVFPAAALVLDRLIEHPATLQYPAEDIRAMIDQHFARTTEELVPMGRYVLQFGVKVRSAFSPVRLHLFTCSS